MEIRQLLYIIHDFLTSTEICSFYSSEKRRAFLNDETKASLPRLLQMWIWWFIGCGKNLFSLKAALAFRKNEINFQNAFLSESFLHEQKFLPEAWN